MIRLDLEPRTIVWDLCEELIQGGITPIGRRPRAIKSEHVSIVPTVGPHLRPRFKRTKRDIEQGRRISSMQQPNTINVILQGRAPTAIAHRRCFTLALSPSDLHDDTDPSFSAGLGIVGS